MLISPLYHRAHHRASGRLDVNLGVVFAIWDVVSRRAIFPGRPLGPVIVTGVGGRPIPVEQAPGRRRLLHLFAVQLARAVRQRPPDDAVTGRRRVSLGSAILAACCLTLAACANDHPRRSPAATAYLAIAAPANQRLDTSLEAIHERDRTDLARAVRDLRRVGDVEQAFDRSLLRLALTGAARTTARNLVAVNKSRVNLTRRAAASTSLRQLNASVTALSAADQLVETQVRVLRRQLGLPPPDDD